MITSARAMLKTIKQKGWKVRIEHGQPGYRYGMKYADTGFIVDVREHDFIWVASKRASKQNGSLLSSIVRISKLKKDGGEVLFEIGNYQDLKTI